MRHSKQSRNFALHSLMTKVLPIFAAWRLQINGWRYILGAWPITSLRRILLRFRMSAAFLRPGCQAIGLIYGGKINASMGTKSYGKKLEDPNLVTQKNIDRA